jgi:hypothetical protein
VPRDVLLQYADALLADHAEPLERIQAAHLCQQLEHGLQQLPQQEHCEDCEAPTAQRAPSEQTIVVGTGGTITTIAALLLHLEHYEHHAVHMSTLRSGDVDNLMKQLADESFVERLVHTWLGWCILGWCRLYRLNPILGMHAA